MSSRQEKIEGLVLQVLSYYEPMSFEMILLDMPQDLIREIPDFNREELDQALLSLKKQKLIKLMSKPKDKDKLWLRLFPKKSIIQRLLSYLK